MHEVQRVIRLQAAPKAETLKAMPPWAIGATVYSNLLIKVSNVS
jgi:hypothetical protein